ncbi:MAG: hypothetical protein AB7G76_12860 [Steroidobacteraceae bacterium]
MKTQKTTVRLLSVLKSRLDVALERACLKRDAYLNRLLERELAELNREVRTPNSPAALAYISLSLKHLGARDLVTLTLRSDLLAKLDGLCTRKRICRDAFFNRIAFLLTAPAWLIDATFFPELEKWRAEVWTECRNDGPIYANVFSPLDPIIDPFWTIRAGLALSAEECKQRGNLPPDGFYTTCLFGRRRKKFIPLWGLSCHMDDALVPRTDASKASELDIAQLISEIDRHPQQRRRCT